MDNGPAGRTHPARPRGAQATNRASPVPFGATHQMKKITRRAARAAGGMAIACAAGLPAPAAAGHGTPANVDSGIRDDQCYTEGTARLDACATSALHGQDGQLGRDADPATNDPRGGLLGFAFTKICNSGEAAGSGTCPADPPLGPGADQWACVRDEVTGIMWEVKTTWGFRDRTLKYTNYSPAWNPVGEYGSATDASGFISRVNKAALCGFKDWQLAHTDKVQTIIAYGIDTPGAARVDAAFFPTIKPNWYWNASPNPSSERTAFAVNFADGAGSNDADRSTPRYVQAIRNGKDEHAGTGRYEVSADGTEVRDTTVTAQLTWRRCVEGMAWDGATCSGTPMVFTHDQALKWAMLQSATTGVAWRVPNVKEQSWIVQREIPSPPIAHKTFPGTPAAPTWTSTPEVGTSDRAWAIDFGVGLIVTRPRTDALYLRLARDPDPTR